MYPEAILKALTGIPSASIALQYCPMKTVPCTARSFATGANSNVSEGKCFCVVSIDVVETLDVVAT